MHDLAPVARRGYCVQASVTKVAATTPPAPVSRMIGKRQLVVLQ